ncbi:YcjX family protein [Vibrio sp. SS-MA-C1-2]|uniref:YcjX family protein n=1 Tax=Vibrio sp. SS-MA-C1-2 TaxID=2908646 RepID=UPI001F2DB844|nr:YcjX family protein [Vibrio sp. SS-MA-C1-2]UJF19986.1 YcjX family protein [Vibrio sp. SS-MA-C1-2]
MKSITNEINNIVNRGLDRHIRLAVTGLSRAGKTAFITSVVNQLLHSSRHSQLPLFAPTRDKRLIGAKRIPQVDLCTPRFDYDSAMNSLRKDPPEWPKPTRDVSEIRLALRYKAKSGALKYLQDTSTLYVDIVDYPGEWLLDLPLLDLDYLTWSKQQQKLLAGGRGQYAQPWLEACKDFDPLAAVDESKLAELSALFTQYLHDCKDKGEFHWVQPGRFVLPGELEGAPVLQFFPFIWLEQYSEDQLAKADKESMYGILNKRYRHYQKKVVKQFYNQHFSQFDRQIILVDCLQPLNSGAEAFNDMRQALEQLMQSFKYGRSSLLSRLFSPKIDKLLFAATKADHITPDQHSNLVSLLQQMTQEAWNTASFEGIKMECQSIASIAATQAGYVDQQGKPVPAIRGTSLQGLPLTVYPGDVPKRLPSQAFWNAQGFKFNSFRPLPYQHDEPLPHYRIDKVLQFLLGDKLV